MTQFQKYDLKPLVRVNFVDANGSRRATIAHIVLQIGLPLVVGAGMAVWVGMGLDVQNGVSVALPATSLLVGAMFGAFVFMTNLRVKLAESPTFAFRVNLLRLVGSGAAACLYLALVSVVLAGLLAIVGSLPALRSVEVAPFVVGLIVAFFAHVGITLMLVVRRLFIVYLDMFAADFNADVSTPDRSEPGTVRRSGLTLEPTRKTRRITGR